MDATAPGSDTTTITGLAEQTPTSSTTSPAGMETTAATKTAGGGNVNSSPSTADSEDGTTTSSSAPAAATTTTPAAATTSPVDQPTTTSSPAVANTTPQFTPQASSAATTTPFQATTPVQSAGTPSAGSSSVLDSSNSAPSSSATSASSSVAETIAPTTRTNLASSASASATQTPTTTDGFSSAATIESTLSAVYETSLYTYTSSGGQVVYATTLLTTYVFVPAATTTGARTLNSNGDTSGGNAFFSKTGAVVGVFLVVGLIVAVIAVGLGFFYVRRKRRQRLDEDLRVAAGGAGDGGAGIARFTDDDSEDGHGNPYDPTSTSDERMSSFGPPATLSSYGAVGLTGAAAGYGLARTPYDQAHDDAPYRRPLSHVASVADSDHARQRRYSAEIGHHSSSPNDGSLHGMASAYGAFSTLGHSRAFSGESTEEEHLPDWALGFFDQANALSTDRSSLEHSGGGVERLEAFETTKGFSPVSSKPDDRIEPRPAYNDDDNVSQESLADGQDYSRKRVLRVANPSDK